MIDKLLLEQQDLLKYCVLTKSYFSSSTKNDKILEENRNVFHKLFKLHRV